MARLQLYEVNTRCWLNDWSAQLRRPATLPDVPDAELDRWRQLGFSHIWLMGVWTTGELSRRCFLDLPGTPARLDQLLPGWSRPDVAGSPYAIAEYRVPERLGGDAGLEAFRRRLRARGMKLILDFVPNHVGLDHPWLQEHPDRFVAGPPGPGAFACPTPVGPRWIAHGRDPCFPPWIDTAQLDFRLTPVRRAVTAELAAVAARCDGVRCDMAMLLLRDVFARTWERLPGPTAPAAGEFWEQAISQVRASEPDFLFLAEAYWDLEEHLLQLGFDFTYDKKFTDFIWARDSEGLLRHLLGRRPEVLRRSVRFLENHDEPRAADRLRLEEHRGAALLLLGLPGTSLLHEGQLGGAKVRTPVQLQRRPSEVRDPAVVELYEGLFAALAGSGVGQGTGRLLQSGPATPSDPQPSAVVVHWAGAPDRGGRFEWVVANVNDQPCRCRVRVPQESGSGGGWSIRDRLPPAFGRGSAFHMDGNDVILNLAPHAACLVEFR